MKYPFLCLRAYLTSQTVKLLLWARVWSNVWELWHRLLRWGHLHLHCLFACIWCFGKLRELRKLCASLLTKQPPPSPPAPGPPVFLFTHTDTHTLTVQVSTQSGSMSLCFNKSNREAKLISAWHNRVTVRERRSEKTSVSKTARSSEEER